MKYVLASLIFLHSAFFAYPQAEDSLLYTPMTPFLKELLSRNYSIPPLRGGVQSLLQTTYPYSIDRAQVLIRKGNQLYIYLENTGKVYKAVPGTDSLLAFRRVDKTVNMNYNGGGIIFLHNNELHVLGGYGFWKTHGNDIKFNERDMEWDVVPSSEEIIAPYTPFPKFWHNRNAGTILVPYQLLFNAGLTDPEYNTGKVVPVAYQLDLDSHNWTRLGATDPQCLRVMQNAILRLEHASGMYLYSEGILYLVDMQQNRVYRMDDATITQSFGRMPNRFFRYEHNNMLYYFDPLEKRYDSLYLNPGKLTPLPFPVYKPDNNNYGWALGAVLLFLVIGQGYMLYRKRRRSVSAPPPVPNKEAFTDIELGLIRLLQDKAQRQETANLAEVNYVLGVKDKNVGLQKKVRSDVITNINEKYRRNTGKDKPLICSIRSNIDKRFFEYYLSDPQPDTVG